MIQQTSSECIQNIRANAGRLLDRVNTIIRHTAFYVYTSCKENLEFTPISVFLCLLS